MKYIKSFKESSSFSESEIDRVCKEFYIENYQINPDGTVDVEGSVYFEGLDAEELPLKFGKVTGDFSIIEALLTTLEGCPYEVGGSFEIQWCHEITSLEHAPKRVGGEYYASDSPITSLEGTPEVIHGNFDCSETSITSLEGGPRIVYEGYYANHTRISNLEGGPEEVDKLAVEGTNLTSLEGLPEKIRRIIITTTDHKIWDPRPLKDSGLEEFVTTPNEPIYELIGLFNRFGTIDGLLPSKSEILRNFIESLDYNYIRGTDENPQIDLFRLKEALSEFDINPLKILFYDNYCLRHYQFIDEEGQIVNFMGGRINK